MSHYFWLKKSIKRYEGSRSGMDKLSIPLLDLFWVKKRYRQTGMDLVYFLRVLQRLHPYRFSDVNNNLRISNMSTEPASKNGQTKRFEYMTSVLITRPEWTAPTESLLTSFQEGGLVEYPSSRSQ